MSIQPLKYLIISVLFLSVGYASATANVGKKEQAAHSTKQERNYVKEGNELYHKQRFAEAEVMYRKALAARPASETAAYNLATSLIRQSGSADPNKGNNPLDEAKQLLAQVAENVQNADLSERAFYNLGCLAYNAQDYKQSIEMFKDALRRNPDNDSARDNLRLAQKKQQEQNQNQNQDRNNDKNQDKEQNKEQNKDQNKEQNQDKNNDQDKNQKQNQNPDQKKDQNKQQPPQQSGISDANAEKILKAMENEEASTRRRVEAQRKKGGQSNRRQPIKPW